MKFKLLAILFVGFFAINNSALAQDPFSSDDSEETIDQNPKNISNKPPLKDRVYFGGNIGASFGNITFVDLSPLAGYRITPEFSAGAGFSYRYFRNNNFVGNTGFNIVGPRVFARYDISDLIYPYIEYENLYAKFDNSEAKTWYDALFIGAGMMQPLGGRGRVLFTLLYNVNYTPLHTLYASEFQYRVGFIF